MTSQRTCLRYIKRFAKKEQPKCDYMLENSPKAASSTSPSNLCCYTWKQVEFNTIASGFGWLGPVSSDIHSG
ncbi:unnamed protein product [Callosobruchus maculatus]|uniref:Uncharacterized protein n=1 Tax=Callosobruchus maculatus TaxID=64391 RepID=A0A653CW29_CALMS|nr:unnamed protein product [Callosobruchus maculatus]